MVLCDLYDHHTHAEVPHSPRAVLKQQIKRLQAMDLKSMVATELEFFVFRESFEELRDKSYRDMTTISPYNEDYHIFQTTKEEGLMRQIRNGLHGAGVRVENTKGEADPGAGRGQRLLQRRAGDGRQPLPGEECGQGNRLSERSRGDFPRQVEPRCGGFFEPHSPVAGIDQLATPCFTTPMPNTACRTLMRHYLAGLLKHASDNTFFLAPYVNSYKRFVAGTFAPTKAIWSLDNRTAGYRVVANGSRNVRVECRVGGSDLNPYLAIAAQIAAGIAGIEGKLELEKEFKGDAYGAARRARFRAP